MTTQTNTTTETVKTHGVYFANLEAYNSGRMIGGWLYPLDYDSYADFEKAIKKVTRFADEIAVHDYDNFPDMGEYPDHEKLYDLIHVANDRGVSLELIEKYAEHFYCDYDFNDIDNLLDEMHERFEGFADDFQEFANMYIEETNLEFQEMSSYLKSYFDYESYARDLEYEFVVIHLSNYTVAIYSNC